MGEEKLNYEAKHHKKWFTPLLVSVIFGFLYFILFWYFVWPAIANALRKSYSNSLDEGWPWYWLLIWLLALFLWSLPMILLVCVCAARYRITIQKREKKFVNNIDVPVPPYPTQLCLIQPTDPKENETPHPLPTSFPALAVKDVQSPYRMSDFSQNDYKISSSSVSSSSSKKVFNADVSTRALYGGSREKIVQEKLSAQHDILKQYDEKIPSMISGNRTSDVGFITLSTEARSDDATIKKSSSTSAQNISTVYNDDATQQLIESKVSLNSSSSSDVGHNTHNVDTDSDKNSEPDQKLDVIMSDNKSGSIDLVQDVVDAIPSLVDLEQEKDSEQQKQEEEEEGGNSEEDDDDVFMAGLSEEVQRHSNLSTFNDYLHLVPLSASDVEPPDSATARESVGGRPVLQRQRSSQSEFFIASAYQKPSVTSEVFLTIAGDDKKSSEIQQIPERQEVVFVGNIDTSFHQIQ